MKSLAHEVRGLPVHALDGKIGRVQDVVFDAASWVIHFLEVETGWLFGRDVLVPTEKIVDIDMPEGGVRFDLSMEAIENSPAAEMARPTTRHYDELFPYFGLSSPWVVDVVAPLPAPTSGEPPLPELQRRLLFARDLEGFDLQAKGDSVGTIRDVLVDLSARRVTSFSADLGGILAPDVAEIRLGPVVAIDAAARVVRIDLRKEEVDPSHRLSADDLPYVLPYIPPVM